MELKKERHMEGDRTYLIIGKEANYVEAVSNRNVSIEEKMFQKDRQSM